MTSSNAVLPGSISQGSEFAPVSLVDIARGPTGNEQRRSRRPRRMRRINIGKNIRTIDDVYDILSFFEVMDGPSHSFAIKNPLDYKSCKPQDTPSATDAIIGSGDGSNATFQLRKQYKVTLVDGSTVIAIDRDVYLPVLGTVLIAVDGVLQEETTDWLLNYETGAVTFVTGREPGEGLDVTTGFEFNERVRFDTNDLSHVMEFFRVGSIPSIPLVEVIPDTESVPDTPPESPWLIVADAAMVPGPLSDGAGWNGYTLRQVIDASVLANTGLAKIRVSFAASAAAGGMVIGAAYIGMQVASGDPYDFAATPSQLLFSGGPIANVAEGAIEVSDVLDFSIEPGGSLVISIQFVGISATLRSNPSGWTNYFKLGTDASTVNASGYTTWAAADCVALIEAASASA